MPVGTGHDEAHSVAQQADGKIVTAGFGFNGTDSDFAVVRYNADGSLDTSFDGDGTVLTPVGTSGDYAYDVALQSDGKIVVAGHAGIGSRNNFAVVRYNTDGTLDTSFGSDGKVTTPLFDTDGAHAVAIQADGKIVAAGRSLNSVGTEFVGVVRYNTDGTLDTSFSGDGRLISSQGCAAYSSALQTDGKIVLSGSLQIRW